MLKVKKNVAKNIPRVAEILIDIYKDDGITSSRSITNVESLGILPSEI